MKNIFITLTLIFTVVFGSMAQPVLTVGNVSGTQGNIVNVPVTLSGCDLNAGGVPLTAMQFFINYSNAVNYIGLTSFYSGMPSADWVYSGNLGQIAANWAEPTYSQALSIPDGTVLFEIQFSANTGGNCPLLFAGDNQLYDVNYTQILSAVFVDGSVNIPAAAAASTWNGTGNWTNTANWSNGIPGTITDATIASGVVTVDIPAFANNLTIEPNAGLTLNSTIALKVNNLVLNSLNNNSATGSFIDNGGILTVNGNTSVKRWLSGGEHHFISNPLRNTLEVSSFVYGNNQGWMYRYDEPTGTWINMWNPLDDIFVSYGYAVNYVLDQMHSFNSTNSSPFNINSTVAPTLTNTSSNGWNLVGNPYPSAINWLGSGWTKTNLDNAIYLYNGTGYSAFVGGVGVNGGTQYIPAGQGFFVHASASGPRLTIPRASTVHNTQEYYKSSTETIENLLRIKISGNGSEDETVVRLSEESTNGFDSEMDAYKLMSLDAAATQIFTRIDADYAINTIPQVSTGTEVALSVNVGTEGSYTINTSGMSSFGNNTAIYLEDTELNTITDLNVTPEYAFTAQAGENNRFKLLINTSAGIGHNDISSFVYTSGNEVFIRNLEGNVQVFAINGQLVASDYSAANSVSKLKLPAGSQGIYLVKLTNDKGVYTGKVLVK